MSRCCSQCGSNGHNSRTCGGGSSSASAADGGGGSDSGSGPISEFMLFGVRVKVDPMRKSVSMNNLSDYEHHPSNASTIQKNSVHVDASAPKAADDVAAGYASADDALPTHHSSTAARERKRGVPWTEEEHKLFLLGLQKVGKGDWRGISRNFVKTRTPTQVASHAQKYFLRKSNLNRRRRRSSLFDLTPDSVTGVPMEEGDGHLDETANPALPATSMPPNENSSVNGFAGAPFPVTVGPILVPVQVRNPLSSMTVCQADAFGNGSALVVRPVPVPVPNYATSTVFNLNQRVAAESVSLRLSLSSSDHQRQSSTRHPAFQRMPSFKNGDSIITVA
ncbi:transcription factor MYB1R1-like [Coffea eugenioides]|uniref:Transcription factor MYB1R1 n=1 Tax=Coffea arabica TaxID=13443 RepID=A0A6P6XII2_COFAR|nr:transcription factor MYB1R1 [Coffea arabica]XP_027125812.1 transcription factor MYB1R1 [Coffea arabica]XP_027169777.1 transcription factor MYB1R1-like [Coffea eugenioides]